MNHPDASLESLKRAVKLMRLKQRADAQGLPLPRQAADTPIQPADRDKPLPLSWAQQRLWLLDQMGGAAGAANHISAGLRLSGRLDEQALRAALDRIVARHEILRTRFVRMEEGGEPVQLIGPADRGFVLQLTDLGRLGTDAQDAAVLRHAVEEASASFELSQHSLIRGRLLKLSANEHVLLLTQHHIISDGWSIGVLIREVSALYAAYAQGCPDPLPPLTIQYADYAAWQRGWLHGDALRERLEYWKSQLSDAPPLLALPTDRPRPARQTFRGDAYTFALPDALTGLLRERCQTAGATLHMGLLAGWSLLLNRLSGQSEVVIGISVANRRRREVEPLIGFFVNTLAVKIPLAANDTVWQLLAKAKECLLGAYTHQDVPFEQVVELLNPERSMAYNPVYQVLFNLDNTPRAGELALHELRVSSLEMERNVTHLDVLMSVTETSGTLSCSLQYASDLFDKQTMVRWARYWQHLLQAMVEAPGAPAARLPMLEATERHTLLIDFNASGTMPSEGLAHTWFEAQAARTPFATALSCDGERVDYAELNRRANRVAHALIAGGVSPDTRVALLMPRSVGMVVALLGILKAGGAYVPLDPDHPRERLRYLLQDSAPAMVVAQAGHQIPYDDARVLVLNGDGQWPQGSDFAEHNSDIESLRPHHLAYVIYTSGSTGQPKGVMVEHRNLCHYLCWALQHYGTGRALHTVVSSPLAFDATITSLYLPLLTGGEAVLLRSGDELTGLEACLRGARDWDLLKITPAHLKLLGERLFGDNLPCRVRLLVVGGEALGAAIVAAWREHAPGVRLINEFGPTETVVGCSIHEVADSDSGALDCPIGRPIANTQIYVLDAHGEPVPIGVTGELYIGGAGVARGYLNRPELTAERFVHDRFGPPGGRLYRTGDLGRWRADGVLEYLGRNDHQVKVRGFRIELGEIEAALLACEGIREAVVVAREDVPGDKRLTAYVVGTPDGTEALRLREQLSQRLADYMLPAAYVSLDAMPLSSNGKLDRNALPAPDGSSVATQVYEAPQGEIETALAELWQELLGVERVGRQDDFFELGGHSLLAVQLVSRVRQLLGREVPLDGLFQEPSLSGFAKNIVSHAHKRDALPPLQPCDRSKPIPLSWSQQRLWFLDQLDRAAGSAYHIPAGLRLRGELNVPALQRTLDRIVARHEVLRTQFARTQAGGEPAQWIGPATQGFALHMADLSQLPADRREAAVLEHATEEASAPFDLSRDPLIRGRLLTLSAHEHVLLVTQHHIVSDGWSIGVLVREVGALYEAFVQGNDDPLPPLAIQYADYAAWQRGWLQGDVLRAQLDYWKEQLSTAPPLLTLPTDRPRPARQSYRGGAHYFTLPETLVTRLREHCQAAGVTLYMGLLANWSLLLSRLSGQSEVVIGIPVANRRRREVEPLIGFFVNTLAVKMPVHDGDTWWSLLDEAKTRLLGAYAHQDVPFEQVVEVVNPGRSLAYSPIYQAVLNLNNTPGDGAIHLPGLQLSGIAAEHDTTHFDLSLSLLESGNELQATLEYASDLFDASTIARWSAHWECLLGAMLSNPEASCGNVPILREGERQSILQNFNDTATVSPEGSIHAMFEAQVSRTPDATAVVYQSTTLSYAELNCRANRVAHALIAAGVRPDTRVALCMERGLGQMVGLLGILKAGGAYVPLDPAYPRQRLNYMVEDCAPAMMLVQAGLESVIDGANKLVLDGEGRWAEEHSYSEHNSLVDALRADHLAYVIYTSGSTGRPKGVLVEHAGLCNLVQSQASLFGVDAQSRVLQFASMNFDVSLCETFMALCRGACLCLAPQDELRPGQPLSTTLRRHRVTHVLLTLSVLASGVLDMPSSVQVLVAGGEPCPPEIARQWSSRCRFFNAYGPTETTVCASVHACTVDEQGIVPIGHPIANTQMYVLDAHGEPVPIGVTGELYIGGAGVARGYLNRPELTAERFVDDRFGPPGGRLYRTGDLGRWRADRALEFLGRNDHQVKLRGFRIELGEIEAALLACEGIREAVVVAREDVPGDRRLVAYVVGDEACTKAVMLREQLSQRLADYMLPAAYVSLDAMPLSSNGKLDRNALPAPDGASVATQTYEAPQGEIETTLAELWKELLGLEQVGRHDQFFELGGHSLLAVQLVSRVQEAFRRELALREVFAHATLAGMAQQVAQAEPMRGDDTPLARVDRQAPLPLSWSQQRLWFLDQLDHAASAAYHMPAALRLEGTLDKPALQRALDRIVARHEILRTRFERREEGGEPVQVIAEQAFALRESDLRALSAEERETAIVALARKEARAPFELSRGPLIRGHLLQLSAREHVLLVTQHHIVSDGWSIGVLVREVGALYEAFVQGHADPLPPLAIQYADYAAWQRGWLQGDVLREQLDYWKEQLATAPPLLALPTDRPRPAQQSYRGGALPFTLPAALVEQLRERCQSAGATLYMGLLASWATLMSRLSGQAEVVIGTTVANRRRKEIEPLVGFFVNTLAVNVPVKPADTAWSLLVEAKERLLGAYAHQDVPLEQVVETVNPGRSMAYSPLFQTTLNMNNAPGSDLQLPGLSLQNITGAIEHVTAHFDLSLSLTEEGPLLRGRLEYASDLFDETTLTRWMSYWERLLWSMIREPETPVQRLPLLDAHEQRLLLDQFNDTVVAPVDGLIHALFEAQVTRTPDGVALAYEETSLSYAELNRRANRVAHALIAAGVAPDTRVALCMERGPGQLVGLLGILKAGGAYVPLDPAYPRERLAYLMADSAPVMALVQSSLESVIDATRRLVLDNEGRWADELSFAENNPLLDTLHPDHLAYVIYTSGSTGKPKGVMVEHRSVVNLWAALKRDIFGQFGTAVRVAMSASLAFDASVKMWIQLLSGHCIVPVPSSHRADARALLGFLSDCSIDVFDGTPTQLELLVAEGLLHARGHRPAAALIGGEPISSKLWNQLRQCEEMRFHNVYGPTECTVDATTCLIGSAHSEPNIGRPIANVHMYVLDAHGEPVPIGVTGELYIGGAGVARGYLNRPELTAERFVDDRFGPPGGRLYRTGDLGRWRADGVLEYLGRNDHQVKVRGFRIELGEIEAALLACEGIREAVVVAREDVPGDKRLTAYVVGTPDGTEALRLREQLSQRLADYMLPAAYVSLDAMPLSSNGKLDRNALPAPDGSSVATQVYEAPQGEIETALAELWQELLGVERVGRQDDFFELGGHSLLAVQLVGRVRQVMRREVTLRRLFEEPSLSGFAGIIAQAEPRDGLPPLSPCDRQQPVPLSWSQQRLWFLDQLDHAAGAAYHMPAALRLEGPLNEQALRQALDRVVARHDILRTRFVRPQQGGEPVQLIDARGAFQLQRTCLGDLPAAMRDAAVARHASEEALVPFDLSQGPLIRARLLVLSTTEHVLLLTRHHIVSDGWSTGVLVREMGALYEAFVRGQADPLPPLAIQYADYAAWQRGWLQGDLLQTQLDYWKSQLAHAPALLQLPTDHPRPVRQSYRGGTYDFVLPQVLVERLRERCKTSGATLHMGLLAAWSLLLNRLSGQAEIVVGVPVANRRRKEIEPLIGFFVNTLAVNLPIEGSDTAWSLIAEARHRLLGAYAHQDVPFEQVVEAINPDRSMAYSPLFQAILNLNNAPRSELHLAGLSLQNITGTMGHATTHFDLSMSLTEDAGMLRGQLEYASDLFEESTIARWAGYWEHLLRGMVDTPDLPVGQLPLCDAQELPPSMHAVSVGMNTAAEHLIHTLFEAQAARTPEAIALVYEQQQLSYAELNRRANQLAHALLASGVTPDMRVGLCMERSLGLVVGVLGILKAGGAYVPLDPAYPRERLQHLIEDSAPAIVLVQSGLENVLEAKRVLVIGSDGQCPYEQDLATDNPVIAGLRPDHLAYVIYTSGSTGQPKGAMVEHRQVARLFEASSRWFDFGPQEVWTLFHSYAFDFSVWEIWGALLHGGRLVVVPFEVSRSPEHFHALLRRERVSFLNQTPSAFQGLLRVDANATERLHVRQVALGGEALDAASLLPWFERYGEQARLLNMYGPTETTVAATFHPVTIEDLRGPGGSIIGRALPDLAVRLVDAFGQDVPIGVPGELWIAGAGVSRGYLDRPELTAERFVSDETSARHRWYRSGDLVRRRADGNLQYLGRIDTQVKVRGFRIELGEIEAALLACEGIREAAVLAREDTPGDKRLVAYVTGAAGQVHAAALRERLARRLPDYMLPAAYVVLDAMPLNANGKLDRRSLPPPAALSAATRDYEMPQSETEAALAKLWEELLGIERIGRGDHFFELGGHSLLAVEMVGRAQKSLQRHIDLKELFIAPVLQDFAAAITMVEAQAAKHSSLVPIRPQGASQPLFLVHGGAGGAHYAQSLARWIDCDVPIYGLEPKGYLTDEVPLETVQDMARRYVDAIRKVQPHGPYRISGWSGGGTIAYEMASLLLGMDEQVPFVGLIDTLFEQAPKPDVRGMVRHYASAPFDAAEEFILMLSRFEDGADADAFELPPVGTDFASTVEFFATKGRMPESLRPLLHDLSAVKQYLWVCHANRKAIWNYVPHAFSGPVTLFSAARENRADPSIGWSKMLGKHLQVVLVDGWHFNMVEDPFAEGLGHAISAAMRASTTQPAQHSERDYMPCITIQAGRRDAPAVFCVPGAGASVTSFAELAITLDVGNPLYGLQPRGLCGQMSPHPDVPSASRAYVKAIRNIAPHGPYRLLGHSFGGWVALETALQLEDAGETVLSITVLDTQVPSLAPSQSGYLGELDVLLRLIEIFEMHPGVDLQLPASVLEPLAFDDRLRLLLRRLVEARRMPARAQLQTLRGIYRVFNRNLHTGYQPRRMYRGSFHAAVAPGADVSEHTAQWRNYVEDPQVWQAEGNHVSLLGKPHVETLARWLQPILVGEEAPA